MESTNKFPELDFSMLLHPEFDFAVHCSTDAQALHFIKEVRRQYPKNSWGHNNTGWKSNAGKIAYAPYINRGTRMTRGCVSHYSNMGFVIVEFEDLIPLEKEITESECSLDILFGGSI